MMSDRGKVNTDLEVVAAMAGDHRAQSELWRSYRPWLAAILLAYKPREIDVEDLMQEVAVKFVSRVHTLRDPGAFRPWLRRIAINAARESARTLRGRNRPDLDLDLLEQERHLGPVEGTSTSDEAKALLAHALTLPPEFREPLILRCVRGMGARQIAALLDLPITTIETRLSRARRMLREEWRARTEAADERAAERKENAPRPGERIR